MKQPEIKNAVLRNLADDIRKTLEMVGPIQTLRELMGINPTQFHLS